MGVKISPVIPWMMWTKDEFYTRLDQIIKGDSVLSSEASKSLAGLMQVRSAVMQYMLASHPPAGNA